MGLLPLPPSPPLSTGPPILNTKEDMEMEAGPSKLPIALSQSSQDTSTTITNTATPPTSPLPIPSNLKSRKRRRNSLGEDGDDLESYCSTSDDEFLPSPAASTSASTSTSTLTSISTSTPATNLSRTQSLRGGGKKPPPKSRKQTHTSALSETHSQSKPNSQGSSNTNTTTGGKSNRKQKQESGNSRRTTRSKAKRASSPSDLVTTSLEEIALEENAVKSEISRLGLTLRDVKGDGNCLFRVLSDQGFGGEKRHAEIRKLVCDYLETHKDVMEGFVVPFMKDGEGYEGYVTRMRQLKQFGSHIEIQAAARVFKRNIRVVMSTTSFTIPWQTEAPTSKEPPATPSPADVGPVPTTPSHRTRSKTVHTPHAPSIPLPDYLPSAKETQSMLWLALFSQAEHFQSIRRMGDREHGPAEVEDKLSIPHARDVSEAARRERGELVDEKKPKTPLSLSAKINQLLNSLPAGHGITLDQAQSVLGRTHGDIGEAVEILLEEIDQEKEGDSSASGVIGSDSGSSDHVEQMLHSPSLEFSTQVDGSNSKVPTEVKSISQDFRYNDGSGRSLRLIFKNPASPSNTATTSTETRSLSRSRSRSSSGSGSGSGSKSDSTSILSGNTSDTELFDNLTQTTTTLSDNLKIMKVDPVPDMEIDQGDQTFSTQPSSEVKASQKKPKERRRSAVNRESIGSARGERRRSARLGTVGA